MRKTIRYILAIFAIILLVFLSIDIRRLDEVQSTAGDIADNPGEYANMFWDNELPSCIDNALEINRFLNMVSTNSQQLFRDYGRQLGISQTWYFMIKGVGVVTSVEEEYLVVNIDENSSMHIATDFIFGNAVRDGSGRVNIDDFLNMTDFNNVSLAINKLVKDKVVAGMISSVKPGMTIEFAGATEISENNIDTDALRIIPVSYKLTDGRQE